MKKFKIQYILTILAVMVLLPLMNNNLYCDHGDGGDGHGHGNGDVKLTGTITAITLTSVTVDSTEFAVNSETKIEGKLSFDLFLIGDTVKVEGKMIDSVLTATEIKLFRNGGDDNGDEHGGGSEFSIKGLISELSDSTLTVDGQSIVITDSTVVKIEGQDSASISDLSVGLKVEVEGNIVDSSYFAQKIKIESEGEHHNGQEFEISGKISATGADNFTVDTLTIYVDSNTGFVKEHAGVISFADLAVGDSVRVKGTIDSNGIYTAEKVKVIVNEQLKVEEEGLISDVTDSTVTVNISTFVITSDTRIRKGDSTVDKSALTIGERVHIKGLMTDSSVIAMEIMIQNNGEHHDSSTTFELKGAIESINGDSVTVDGTTFLVDSNTVIKMEEVGLIQLSDLVVGMDVEVKGTIVNDVYLATKIEVKGNESEDNELNGEITAIQDSTITVNNTLITVNAETVIFSKDSALTFADLAVGDFVKVKYNIVDSINFALEIKVKPGNHSHNDSDEVAEIETVSSTQITANNRNFSVDEATTVFDRQGSQLSLSELKQSMKVYIYEDLKNGQLYASRIDVLQQGVSEVSTDVQPLVELMNEPNPFSEATIIKLKLPNEGKIVCSIYDESGRKVLDIYNGFAVKGENEFTVNGNTNLGTGTYYINLFYNGISYTRAIIKLK